MKLLLPMRDTIVLKWRLKTLFLVIVIFSGCAPKLGKEFYDLPCDILIQRHACYFPKGYTGLTGANYPGVFAIVKNEIVFDAVGPGSRPWMSHIWPFKIEIQNVDSIKLSEDLDYNRNVITVYSKSEHFDFYMSEADSVYLILDQKMNE